MFWYWIIIKSKKFLIFIVNILRQLGCFKVWNAQIKFQWTRSIPPPCPIYGMWGGRKTSWDGSANKKNFSERQMMLQGVRQIWERSQISPFGEFWVTQLIWWRDGIYREYIRVFWHQLNCSHVVSFKITKILWKLQNGLG